MFIWAAGTSTSDCVTQAVSSTTSTGRMLDSFAIFVSVPIRPCFASHEKAQNAQK